jgi:phage shock protein A
MPLFRNLKLLVGTALKGLLTPATDPRSAVVAGSEHLEETLARLRRSLADIGEARGRLQRHATTVRARLEALDEQARAHFAAGRTDAARLVLERRATGLSALEPLEAQVEAMAIEEGRLAASEQRLAARIEAIRLRDDLLAARFSTAEAQLRISVLMAGLTAEVGALGGAMEAAETRTGEMEARAAAIDHLVETRILGDGLFDPPPSELRA